MFSSLSSFSQSSWKELQLKRKQSGGYETIEYGEMKESIANRLPKEKNISDDTKLIVLDLEIIIEWLAINQIDAKLQCTYLALILIIPFIIMAVNEFTLSTEFRAKLIL